MIGNIVQELLADTEGPSGQRDLGLAGALDLVHLCLELLDHMSGIGRRTQQGHRLHLRQFTGRNQDRRAAQAVADQHLWRRTFALQPAGGGQQIGDVGRKIGIREIAVRLAQPGEIEPQHAEALL